MVDVLRFVFVMNGSRERSVPDSVMRVLSNKIGLYRPYKRIDLMYISITVKFE